MALMISFHEVGIIINETIATNEGVLSVGELCKNVVFKFGGMQEDLLEVNDKVAAKHLSKEAEEMMAAKSDVTNAMILI